MIDLNTKIADFEAENQDVLTLKSKVSEGAAAMRLPTLDEEVREIERRFGKKING